MKNSRASYIDGRHFTGFLDEVRSLKASANHAEAEILLLRLIDATESDPPPASWYYEQLAIIYRKDKRLTDEAAILERFLSHNSSGQTSTGRKKLLIRYNKVIGELYPSEKAPTEALQDNKKTSTAKGKRFFIAYKDELDSGRSGFTLGFCEIDTVVSERSTAVRIVDEVVSPEKIKELRAAIKKLELRTGKWFEDDKCEYSAFEVKKLLGFKKESGSFLNWALLFLGAFVLFAILN